MPVHNELRQPTGERVRWWLRSTVWGSTLFYLTLGIAGSAYGACSDGDFVQGNILLGFPEDDPLVAVWTHVLGSYNHTGLSNANNPGMRHSHSKRLE